MIHRNETTFYLFTNIAKHCAKYASIRVFSDPYIFPGSFSVILSLYGKIRVRENLLIWPTFRSDSIYFKIDLFARSFRYP